ncbi:MAG: FtsX-like permease family protein, partial [Gammaproteobacteria bacterium]|nr:FtsX-like permease family protein [Gammaproteobacteria bacterium]
RSGQLNLLLYSVFRVGDATANVSWESYQKIARHPDVAWTIPISLGDSHRGFRVMGTNGDYFKHYRFAGDREITFASGKPFEDLYDAVVGAEVAKQLGYSVGSKIVIAHGLGNVSFAKHDDKPFTVIGVLAKKGQGGMGDDQDDAIFVPVSAFQARIQGGLGQFVRGPVYVSAMTSEAIEPARAQIASLLRERHRLAADAEDDFSTTTMAEMTGIFTSAMSTLTNLLAAIALVSLVVGGIGVMNIMLVSVTERTREIGIRMAVGAQPGDILRQFLIESLTLAAIGGAIGVLLGLGIANLVAAAFGWSMLARTDIILMALGVSAGVGVIFGLYPALKASRLDPIAALRYE